MAENQPIETAQLLAQFSQMYRTEIDTAMESVGMFRGQALLLCTLVKRDGMSQTEIAEQLSVQGATITNMLQRMEESGLVVRHRDADDNRLVRVFITKEGKEKESAITQQLSEFEETVLHGISQKDRVTLQQLIWQMIENISN